ncbi:MULTISPECIES: NADH-quinone oxidoreductase subunit N [unclassified Paraflavitalea]|uniref:NADH-quinone oxidoreductase subunit N n=1 Tax=unclassified Paraflavitalea TaxID=2798305 RepID=UPI003D3269F0
MNVASFFSLMRFELVITLLIFVLLIAKIGKGWSSATVLNVATIGVAVALGCMALGTMKGNLFASMFQMSAMVMVEKVILLLAMLVFLVLNRSFIGSQDNVVECIVLLLSSLLGMLFLVSSGHFLFFYLSLELATIPLVALSSFQLQSPRSAESGIKFSLNAAFSSAILLMGISFLYGATGTLVFSEFASVLTVNAFTIMGFVVFFSGLAFKMSAVPFHLWTADVYEGAPVPVTSFLAAHSKAAFGFVLIPVLFTLFGAMQVQVLLVLKIVTLATIIVGNLFALRQKDVSRFLAFSSVSQAGYILLGYMAGSDLGNTAVVYFLFVYVLATILIFGIVGLVRLQTGYLDLEEYKGFYHKNKTLSVGLIVGLAVLAGIPPTAGFFGKLYLIMAGATSVSVGYILVVVMNLVIALYYYLRWVRLMFVSDHETIEVKVPGTVRWVIVVLSVVLTVMGFFGGLFDHFLKL